MNTVPSSPLANDITTAPSGPVNSDIYRFYMIDFNNSILSAAITWCHSDNRVVDWSAVISCMSWRCVSGTQG